MGRRLNLSTPTVINTELVPLDESFYIEANGNTEQWYYDNTNVYAPNRNVIPLTLTPRLSVFDGDTKTTYTPTFYMVKWYAKEYNATQGEYVETQITTTDPAATDYVLSGNNLLVKKNVPYSHDVTIRCEATYTDPRDTGVTSTIQDTVTLLTNRDASTISPMLEIDCPASQGFNPLTATTSKYTLKGRASWGQDLANDNIVTFKADPLGTENIIPTNEDSIDSAAPTLSLRYGSTNQADQTFMSRQTSGGQVGNIEGNVGYVTNIKGDTVKLVQKFDNPNFESAISPWWGSRGNTSVSGNICTFTVTEVAADPWGNRLNQQVRTTQGHKYYIGFDFMSEVAAPEACIRFNVSQVDSTPKAVSANAWTKVSGIITCTTSERETVLLCFSQQNASVGSKCYTSNAILLDLTAMGIDNLTTVEQVESWLATHIGTRSYYPYTEGRLINYGGYQVKMNQLVPARSGSNDGVDTRGNESSPIIIFTGGSNIMYQEVVTSPKTVRAVVTVPTNSSYFVVRRNGVTRDYYMIPQNAISISSLLGHVVYVSTKITAVDYAKIGGYKWDNTILVDLTLMFGAGNEPDLDWCNAHFTEDYYPYHTGYDTNLLSVADEDLGIKTVGFNLWDEEWELGGFDTTTGDLTERNGIRSKNYIPVKPLTTYYFKASGYAWCALFDKDKNIIDASSVRTTHSGKCFSVYNTSFTTLSDAAFMKFYMVDSYGPTYRNDICISLSSSKNGTYEPYWESFTDMSWVSKIGIENFNIWDEEISTKAISQVTGEQVGDEGTCVSSLNYIPVLPNTDYYVKCKYAGTSGLYIKQFDSGKSPISDAWDFSNKSDTTITTSQNACYIKFMTLGSYGTTYNYDICINKSIAHFNGRYYPRGVPAPYFPNGLCKAGDVVDEIKVVDGKIKGVVRIGSVDLGSLWWAKYGDTTSYGTTFHGEGISNAKTIGKNIVCSIYTPTLFRWAAPPDDSCYWGVNGFHVNQLCIRDESYDDVSTFKTAMQGVMFYYELATSYEFEIDYPTKSLFEWYGISNNVEVKADTLPWYVDGQNTDTLTVDAMYGEEIRVVLRAKKNYGTDLYPSKAYRSILWRIPDIDSSVLSENGSAVRSDTESMNFGTIVNIKGDTLSDDVKKEHLRFHWRSRRDNSPDETDQGWGLTKELPASELINVKSSPSSRLASTIVYPEVYLLGAYEKVTDEGNDVTEDGELVYDRPVF